jgi:hypothetical protein
MFPLGIKGKNILIFQSVKVEILTIAVCKGFNPFMQEQRT